MPYKDATSNDKLHTHAKIILNETVALSRLMEIFSARHKATLSLSTIQT